MQPVQLLHREGGIMGGTPPTPPRPFGQFFDLIAQVEKM